MNDDINIPMIPRVKFVAENSLTVEKTLVGTLVNANEILLTTPVINIAQLTILIDSLIFNCVSPFFYNCIDIILINLILFKYIDI